MLVKKFSEIKAWQKAHELVLFVYSATDSYPKSETFGLTSQIRRCAVSVPSNIAEGFQRKTKSDSMHFYNISQSSLEELKYQLLLSRDLGYITQEVYTNLSALSDETGKLIHGWMQVQK